MAQQYTLPTSGSAQAGPASPPDAMALEKAQKALLATIARGEAPKGAYDYMLGGGRFTDFSRHPNKLNSSPYGSSTAAGQYQFLKSTWDEQAKKYGYTDFKPGTQDTAALNYARDTYEKKTGRKLDADLLSTDPKVLNGIGYALNKTWTSLPGGPQPNSNWAGKDFSTAYNDVLSGRDSGGGTAASSKPPGEGGIGADAAASQRIADAAAAAAPATAAAPEEKKTSYADAIGEALQGFGAAMKPVAQAPAAAPIAPTAQMTTPTMTPTVDPKAADMQRQQLAMAMQRLNSGKLF